MGHRGVTLVELLMAGLILTLVGGVALVLAQAGQTMWVATDGRLASLAQAQQAMNRLTEDLREACASSLSCPANQLAFKRFPCGAGDPVITYAWGGVTLTRQVGGAAPATVSSNVSAFSSRCATDGIAGITLTAQATTLGLPSNQTISSQIRLQNP